MARPSQTAICDAAMTWRKAVITYSLAVTMMDTGEGTYEDYKHAESVMEDAQDTLCRLLDERIAPRTTTRTTGPRYPRRYCT